MTNEPYAARVIVGVLYAGMMGREPDKAGLEHWAKIYLENPEAVYKAFLEHDEHKARWATLQKPVGPAIAAFIAGVRPILVSASAGTNKESGLNLINGAIAQIDKYNPNAHAIAQVKAIIGNLKWGERNGWRADTVAAVVALWAEHKPVLANGGITDTDWLLA